MKKLIVLAILGILGWQAYGRFQGHRLASMDTEEPVVASKVPFLADRSADASNFRCDGRIHCSQMTSCAEATWFLRNCPGTKMDGNRDGVPCEQQWCR